MSLSKKKEPSELPFRNGSSDHVVYPSTSSDSNKKVPLGQCIDDLEPVEFKTKFAPKMKVKSILVDSFWRIGTGRSCITNEFIQGFEPINPNLDRFGFYRRYEKVYYCGSILQMKYGIFDTGEVDYKNGSLIGANFCKDRLCPMCNWRRSLKIFAQSSKIMSVIGSEYLFLFLTLTVRNCSGEDLVVTLNNMNGGFKRFKNLKAFKKAVKGYHRVLEITVNPKDGTYHPHFHLILAVDKDYLKSNKYITHDKWLQMWQDSMNDHEIKFVNIKAIKPKLKDGKFYADSLSDAVAEVSKYAVKSSDFLGKLDKKGNIVKKYNNDIIDQRVFTLACALRNRRLSVYGGVFLETLKSLNLDDAENGDLVFLNDSKLNPYIAYLIVMYGWTAGIGKYSQIDYCIEEGCDNE